MEPFISFLFIFFGIVNTIAMVISLKWRYIRDIPGPDRPETNRQKTVRIVASIWLVVVGIVTLLLAIIFILATLIKVII